MKTLNIKPYNNNLYKNKSSSKVKSNYGLNSKVSFGMKIIGSEKLADDLAKKFKMNFSEVKKALLQIVKKQETSGAKFPERVNIEPALFYEELCVSSKSTQTIPFFELRGITNEQLAKKIADLLKKEVN